MPTSPVRVPETVHAEVHAAARLMGCNSAELLERAWNAYRQTPEFNHDLETAQKAFATGDLNQVAALLQEQGSSRAARRAASVRALRTEGGATTKPS